MPKTIGQWKLWIQGTGSLWNHLPCTEELVSYQDLQNTYHFMLIWSKLVKYHRYCGPMFDSYEFPDAQFPLDCVMAENKRVKRALGEDHSVYFFYPMWVQIPFDSPLYKGNKESICQTNGCILHARNYVNILSQKLHSSHSHNCSY